MIEDDWIEVQPGIWQPGPEARKRLAAAHKEHGPRIRAELLAIYNQLERKDHESICSANKQK